MSLSFKEYMGTETGHLPGYPGAQEPKAVMVRWVGTPMCSLSQGCVGDSETGGVFTEASEDMRTQSAKQILPPCGHETSDTLLTCFPEEERKISERGKCPDWDFKLT